MNRGNMKYNVNNVFYKNISSHMSRFEEDGIITNEQKNTMLSYYDVKKQPSPLSIISTIGAILIGIGLLVFIAGNWNRISPLMRMALLLAGIITFYTTGIKLNKSHPKTAFALRLLTSFLFAGSIFLTDQTFNLNRSISEMFLIISFGILVMNLAEEHHKIFYILHMFLLSAIFVSLIINDYELSGFTFPLHWILTILFMTLAIILFKQTSFSTLGINITSLTLGLGIISLLNGIGANATVMVLSSFIYGLIIVTYSLKPRQLNHIFIGHIDCSVAFLFMGISGFILTFSEVWYDLIPIDIPIINAHTISIIFMIAFFAYLLFLYNKGYGGSIVFIIAIILRCYFDMFYSFMPKSLFFIIGGAILMGSGWYMERNRRKNKKEDVVNENL